MFMIEYIRQVIMPRNVRKMTVKELTNERLQLIHVLSNQIETKYNRLIIKKLVHRLRDVNDQLYDKFLPLGKQ